MTNATELVAAEVPPELLRISEQRQGFADEYPFRSRWLRIGQQVLHYIDEGTGPVLLCVHGNPTWSFAWRNVVRQFQGQFRVIAIDHLGCGFSEKPANGGYRLADHVSRLEMLVKALDLSDITLMAHDWGGAIGMGCASRNPARFRRFVLMNTAAFRSQQIPLRIAVCRIPGLGEFGMRALNLFSAAAVRMAVERPLSAAAKAGFLAPYNSWAHRKAVSEFVHDIPLSSVHPSYDTLTEIEHGLEQFRQHPVLLPWGMRDWCFTPDFYDEFCERFPDAVRHPIADAGHYVFEDSTQELLDVCSDFFSATNTT